MWGPVAASAFVLSIASPAAADGPYAVGVAAGPQMTLLADDALLGQVAVYGTRRFRDRWHAGVRLDLEAGTSEAGPLTIGEVLVEGGVWLHASKQIDVLLAWRFGGAHLAFGPLSANALAIEPVAELAFRLGESVELEVCPLALTAFRDGLWQFTLGFEAGVAWRL